MKTKEEQIIEIFQKYRNKNGWELKPFADAIMALPLDLPDETEAETEGDRLGEREDSNKQRFIDGNYVEGFMDCYKWAIAEIIKRNVK